MAMRRTSAARTSERRGGFTLVETAVALAVAALFSAAVAAAVTGLLRADETATRWREAVLWHETLFARRALGLDPGAGPSPSPGWTATVEAVALERDAPVARVDRYRFAPAARRSFVQTAYGLRAGE